MDTPVLVKEKIEEGQKLVDRLLHGGFGITCACWVLSNAEEAVWSLDIVSPQFDDRYIFDAYQTIYGALQAIGEYRIDFMETNVLRESSHSAKVLMEIFKELPNNLAPASIIRSSKFQSIGYSKGLFYPLVGEWQQKIRFFQRYHPSAKILSVELSRESSTPEEQVVVDLGLYFGKVNRDRFVDRAPETLLCLDQVPASQPGLGELLFAYRPEGWNRVYRFHEGDWVETGSDAGIKPYQPVDFDPLSGLIEPLPGVELGAGIFL